MHRSRQRPIDGAVADEVDTVLRDWEHEKARLSAICGRYLGEMFISLSFMTNAINQAADGVYDNVGNAK